MSDVILQEPGLQETNGGYATLTGLGPLVSANKLYIKQRIRACEILSLLTGCEVEKKFNIHGAEGEVLYAAKEASHCCCRFLCGNVRALEINVADQTGKNVIRMSRPINCTGLCCGACYPYCTQSLNVAINGESVGTIRERATWCYPVYHVFDSVGSALLKIRGPLCHFGCCAEDVPFTVTSTDNGEHVATVTKKWGGFCREAVLDADNFVIDFLRNMSVDEKALILASAFLIDLMYFEQQ